MAKTIGSLFADMINGKVLTDSNGRRILITDAKYNQRELTYTKFKQGDEQGDMMYMRDPVLGLTVDDIKEKEIEAFVNVPAQTQPKCTGKTAVYQWHADCCE